MPKRARRRKGETGRTRRRSHEKLQWGVQGQCGKHNIGEASGLVTTPWGGGGHSDPLASRGDDVGSTRIQHVRASICARARAERKLRFVLRSSGFWSHYCSAPYPTVQEPIISPPRLSSWRS
jgi:hypothetical protein